MNQDSPDPGTLDFPGADRLRAAGDVAPPSGAAVDAALRAVRAAAAAERAAAERSAEDAPADGAVVVLAPAAPGRRRAGRLRPAAVAAVAAAAVITAAAVLPGLRPDGDPDRTVTSTVASGAGTFLRHMAAVAAERPGAPNDAAVWRVRTRVWADGREASDTTAWVTRDGTAALVRDGKVSHRPYDAADAPVNWVLFGKRMSWKNVASLPTAPDELRERIVRRSASPSARAEAFTTIDRLLATSPAGPELRAGLFRVLAGIPGVRLVGDVEDGAGRVGTGVELDRSATSVLRMVLDPRTSRVLAFDTVERGALVRRTTYLEAGPANGIPLPGEGPDLRGGSGTPDPGSRKDAQRATARTEP
ncbi:CU044_5270 family protein [Streptomyces sp. NPDC018031]|uniref:CU044_5270 family protein n=1 Tax=Streptomyces sp. NPDC018031 TaxID=3365033 RepID=UPI00379D863C